MKRMQWLMASLFVVAVLAGTGPVVADEGCGKCEGTVKAVDIDAKKITCTKSCGEEMTCAVADDAKITINGEPAKLGDLKAGDKVECMVVKKGDAQIIQRIAAKRS